MSQREPSAGALNIDNAVRGINPATAFFFARTLRQGDAHARRQTEFPPEVFVHFAGAGARYAQRTRRPLGLLADAASPVALFTIGAVLARSQKTSKASAQLS